MKLNSYNRNSKSKITVTKNGYICLSRMQTIKLTYQNLEILGNGNEKRMDTILNKIKKVKK